MVYYHGVKYVVSPFTLKMRKSHKKLARVYAYTHAYTQIRDGGGQICPPPGNNRVKWDLSGNKWLWSHPFWNLSHWNTTMTYSVKLPIPSIHGISCEPNLIVLIALDSVTDVMDFTSERGPWVCDLQQTTAWPRKLCVDFK